MHEIIEWWNNYLIILIWENLKQLHMYLHYNFDSSSSLWFETISDCSITNYRKIQRITIQTVRTFFPSSVSKIINEWKLWRVLFPPAERGHLIICYQFEKMTSILQFWINLNLIHQSTAHNISFTHSLFLCHKNVSINEWKICLLSYRHTSPHVVHWICLLIV